MLIVSFERHHFKGDMSLAQGHLASHKGNVFIAVVIQVLDTYIKLYFLWTIDEIMIGCLWIESDKSICRGANEEVYQNLRRNWDEGGKQLAGLACVFVPYYKIQKYMDSITK